MSTGFPRAEAAADAEKSNREHHGSRAKPTAGIENKASAKSSSQMASRANPHAGESDGDGDEVIPTDFQEQDVSQPSALRSTPSEVPFDDGIGNHGAQRPVETSIWGWEAPREGQEQSSSSIHYEPQGELLQEQQDHQTSRDEFNIPHAVSASKNPKSFFEYTTARNSSDDFIAPREPVERVAATSGLKRITAPESSTTAEAPKVKRAMSKMSVSEEAHSSQEPAYPTENESLEREVPCTKNGTSTTQSFNVDHMRPPLGRRAMTDPGQPMLLPARKVFPIQIGDKLFRLSGASISSDAPSYFSQFFAEQLRNNEGADSVRTLYIDRDPATFEDIALHLQGYHVEPRDGAHFVKLFADAQFYTLPRLTSQLFSSTIYIRIGDTEFQIPRDLFNNPGDSPNYFSLGFSMFFTTPQEVFPGLSERTLLRPPTIMPPSVPNKSAKTFADLLHILKGYPLEIKSEEHRQALLRDARYFHLKGLEQRLIPHEISYNRARKKMEIVIKLEDIRPSGVSFVADAVRQPLATPSPASSTASNTETQGVSGSIYYQRPYVDTEAYSLILEIAGGEDVCLLLEAGSSVSSVRMGRVTFRKQTLQRVSSLFAVIASKMDLPLTQPLGRTVLEEKPGVGSASLPVSSSSEMTNEMVKVMIGGDADVILNHRTWSMRRGEDSGPEISRAGSKRPRRQEDDQDESEEWIVRKSQWRLRVQPAGGSDGKNGIEVVMAAVKVEAFSHERARNASRGFLS